MFEQIANKMRFKKSFCHCYLFTLGFVGVKLHLVFSSFIVCCCHKRMGLCQNVDTSTIAL
jgi:hypothetical protein